MTRQRGMTLVEVLVAITVLGVALAAFTGVMLQSQRTNSQAGIRAQAVQSLNYLGRRAATAGQAVVPIPPDTERSWAAGTLGRTDFADLNTAGIDLNLFSAAVTNLGPVPFAGITGVEYRIEVGSTSFARYALFTNLHTTEAGSEIWFTQGDVHLLGGVIQYFYGGFGTFDASTGVNRTGYGRPSRRPVAMKSGRSSCSCSASGSKSSSLQVELSARGCPGVTSRGPEGGAGHAPHPLRAKGTSPLHLGRQP